MSVRGRVIYVSVRGRVIHVSVRLIYVSVGEGE